MERIARVLYVAPGTTFTPKFSDESLWISIPKKKSIDVTDLCAVCDERVVLDYGFDSNRTVVQVRMHDRRISFHFTNVEALQFACGFYEVAKELGLNRKDLARLIAENIPSE